MTTRDAAHEDWLDAVDDGAGYALVCPEGHGSLPPRRACPECGATSLSEEPLPAEGSVETFTVVHVPPPRFDDDAPYVTAIAGFGSVRLTGVLRGVDPDDDAVPLGLPVEVDVGTRETDGGRIVVFRPLDA